MTQTELETSSRRYMCVYVCVYSYTCIYICWIVSVVPVKGTIAMIVMRLSIWRILLSGLNGVSSTISFIRFFFLMTEKQTLVKCWVGHRSVMTPLVSHCPLLCSFQYTTKCLSPQISLFMNGMPWLVSVKEDSFCLTKLAVLL